MRKRGTRAAFPTLLLFLLVASPLVGQDPVFDDGFETGLLTPWFAAECGLGAVANGLEILASPDWCSLAWPPTLTAAPGTETVPVYGRVYEAGVTEPPGAAPGMIGELLWGPPGTSAVHLADRCLWVATPADYSMQNGAMDEYWATFVAPSVPGLYPYAYRFSLDGVLWLYCDLDGAGSYSGDPFSPAQQGVLTVAP